MRNRYTKENLDIAISSSSSWREVCAIVGCKVLTGSQSHLMRRAREFGLSWPHFLGQAHNKGKTSPNKKHALEYCKKDYSVSSHRLKKSLIRDGIKKAECERCKFSKWMNEDIVLELDHIDNDHFNNEITNLMILCPNCHALKTRQNAGVVKLANTH